MDFRSSGSSKRRRLRMHTEMLEARTMLTSQMLADFIGGENQLQTDAFHELNGETYFVRSGLEQVELWKTDGTDDGTEQVKVLAKQPKHSTFSVDVKKVRDELLISLSDNYFSFWLPLDRPVNDEYFLSDGTSGGTRSAHELFTDFQTGRTAYRVLDLEVEDDEYLLFEYGVQQPADAPIRPTVQLGITDGTGKGTRKLTNERLTVSEAVQVEENLVASSILDSYSFGGGTTERELWISDGITTGGAVVDLWESGDSQPQNLVEVGSSVFFSAETELGRELWQSDGTADGTQIVADILAGEGSSNPTDLVSLDGHVFFLADNGGGTSLWKSDGTDTAVVETSGTPSGVLCNGDQIYFATSNEAVGELQFWRLADASSAPVSLGSIPQPAEAMDVAIQEFDEILLATISGESSSTLVSIVEEGVSVLGEPGANLHIHGQAHSDVFFSRDQELWKTDGSSAEPVGARNLTALAEVNDNVMFSATIDETVAIWSYDGTTTTQLKPLPSKSGSIQVHSVTNIGGTSLLMVSDQASQPLEQSCFTCGPEFYTYLVATDGESFEQLEDSRFPWIYFAISSPDYPQVYVADGNAYFSDHGFPTDFWKTDFTMEGTESVTTEELSKVDQLFDTSANRFTGPAEVNSPMQTLRMGTRKASFPIGRVGQWQFERSGDTLRIAVLDEWGGYNTLDEPLLRGVNSSSQMLGRDADGAIYFAADVGEGMQLMKGDAEGVVETVVITPEILALLTSANPNRELGDQMYFHVFGRSGQDKIWSLGADGFDEVPLPDDVEIVEFLTVVNDHAIFLSETESHGIEIWSSDLSPKPEPKGDINGDGRVGFDDFLILSQNFGLEVNQGEADGDLDGDGIVSFADFLVMSLNFSE